MNLTEILQPAFAVALVLGLLGGFLYLLRRRGWARFRTGAMPFGGQYAGARQLKTVERISLGAQHALHLVRVGDKLILVGTAPGSCRLIDAEVSVAAVVGADVTGSGQ